MTIPTKFYIVQPYGELLREIRAKDLSKVCRHNKKENNKETSKILIDGRQCKVGFFIDINKCKEVKERARGEKNSSEAWFKNRDILQV